MDISKMKNMVVLKNLPSNIVDEAIVILKSNKEIKKLEKIEKSKTNKQAVDVEKDKEYMIREAEMLVNDYISKVENNDKIVINKETKRIVKHGKLLYVLALVAIVEGVFLII